MDLIFTIAGLMLTWSAMSYMRREKRLLARLARHRPAQIYALEVPYNKSQVLAELSHFAKRNHLEGAYLDAPHIEAWVLKSDKAKHLCFPVYLKHLGKRRTLIQIGTASLNNTPYFFSKNIHKQAAKALGDHLKSSYQRQTHFQRVAKRESEKRALVPLIGPSDLLYTPTSAALWHSNTTPPNQSRG